jgi:hypothetical protein
MFDRKTPCAKPDPRLRLVPAREPQQPPCEDLRVAATRDALSEIAAAEARASRRKASTPSKSRRAQARHCRVSFVVSLALIEKLAHLSELLSDGGDEPTIAELLDFALDHVSGSLPAGPS